MEYVTLLPDANQATSGNPPAAVGAAGSDTIEDESDSTWTTFTGPNQWIRVSFANYAIPSNKRIWAMYGQVRDSFVEQVDGSGWGFSWYNYIGPNTVTEASAQKLNAANGSLGDNIEGKIKTRNGPWLYKDWAGVEWTNAQVSATHLYYKVGNNAPLVYVRLIKARIVLGVVTQPVVAVASPGSGVTGVSRGPLVTWTYTGYGEAQNIFQVKVFTQATAEAVGFDPAVAATVYDSGLQLGSAAQWQVPAGTLAAGTVYYVSVQAWKSMNFSGQTGIPAYASAWAPATPFTTNFAPVVSAFALPADPTTTTTKPTVTWTVADTESDPQQAFQVRVFTAAQYGIGGFDPAASPATYDSGIVSSDVSSHQINQVLANATYRAYVRVQQGVDGTWSAWNNKQWVQNVIPPNPPTLTLAPLVNSDIMQLTITPAGAGTVPDYYLIERSYDQVNWEAPYLMGQISYTGTPLTLQDFAVKHNVPVYYRVTAIKTTLDGPNSSMPGTANAVLAVNKVWIKGWDDGLTNKVQVPVEDDWFPIEVTKQRTVHRPFGRTRPVVVRGDSGDSAFGLNWVMEGAAKHDALITLLDSEKVLIVSTSRDFFWAEVMTYTETPSLWDELTKQPLAWRISATFQEVDRPY